MVKARIQHILYLSLFFGALCLLTMLPNLRVYDFSASPLALTYVPLAYIGQSYLFSLLLLIAFIPLLLVPLRWVNPVFAVLAGSLWYLLAIDTWVFSVYRFHNNALFIKMFFTDPSGMGMSALTYVMAFLGLVSAIVLLYVIARWIEGRWRLRGGLKLSLLLFVLTFAGQCIHAWGYVHNMKPIIRVTHTIPLYYPLIANKDIKRWGWFQEDLLEENVAIDLSGGTGFDYPKAAIQCPENPDLNLVVITLESWRFDQMSPEITPHIQTIADQSLRFDNHLSTGNVTNPGLFGLFFGVSPVYTKAAFGADVAPAVIEAVKQMDYDRWILANQDIVSSGFDQLLFPGITPLQKRAIGTSYEGDQGLIDQFRQQLAQRQTDRPFFSYLLFNSTHFRYVTPPGYDKPFEPSENFSPTRATKDTKPLPYLNQYSNSVHYIDSLIGEFRRLLTDAGLWDETLLVITGDHGEEFRDQDVAYWGHGSNFSRYQSGVPLVIHWPGKAPAVYSYRTSHEDVMATVVTDALGCDVPFDAISTGTSLFDAAERTNIIESYVNQGIVVGDVVTELYPGYVKTYDLDNVTQTEQTPAAAIRGSQRVMGQFR